MRRRPEEKERREVREDALNALACGLKACPWPAGSWQQTEWVNAQVVEISRRAG